MSRYHVRLEVREPAFELRTGRRDEPFLAGYDVWADDQDDAARKAIEQFKHDAAMSSVGWQRVVERVIVGDQPVPTDVWDPQAEAEAESTHAAEAAIASELRMVEGEQPVAAPIAPQVEAEQSATVSELTEAGTVPAFAWTGWHTLAVVAGVGVGFYLGLKAARMRDAA